MSSDDDSVDVLDLEDSDTSSLSSYAESDEEENDNASTSNSGWTRLQQPSRNFVNFPFTVSQVHNLDYSCQMRVYLALFLDIFNCFLVMT